jgi:undecaprenyl-diphosphatase
MDLWQAIILGLVEGVTEFLPISSTGHLILASAALGLDSPATKPALDAFEVVVQGGAILAVLGLYWPRVVQMLRGLLGRDAAGLRLVINLIVAFVPAAVLGLLLGDWIEANLFHVGPVAAALGLGGVYMMIVDRMRGRSRRDNGVGERAGEQDVTGLNPLQALLIGVMQCVAMWPGISRSMMTITGGYLVGLRPKAAAEFSFLLGLPTLGAACAYRLGKNLWEAHKSGGPNMFDTLGWTPVIAGIAVATASAALAIFWLVGFLNRRGLTPFGWYRLALCAVVVLAWWMGWVRFLA